MPREDQSETETTFTSWVRGLGTDDRTRAELRESAIYRCQERVTRRSPVIRSSRRGDLFLLKRLTDSLKLNVEDPLQKQLLDALVEAVRTLAGLHPYDLEREAKHQAELVEQENDLKEEDRQTRSRLYDILLNAHEHQHQLSQLYPGEKKPSRVEAALDRLRVDEQWAHDLLAQLRQ